LPASHSDANQPTAGVQAGLMLCVKLTRHRSKFDLAGDEFSHPHPEVRAKRASKGALQMDSLYPDGCFEGRFAATSALGYLDRCFLKPSRPSDQKHR
jgi:hypothetical protein